MDTNILCRYNLNFRCMVNMKLSNIAESWLRRSDAIIDVRIVRFQPIPPHELAKLISSEELYDLGYSTYLDNGSDLTDFIGKQFNFSEHQLDYLKNLPDEIWLEALKSAYDDAGKQLGGDVPLKSIKIIGKYSEADVLSLQGIANPKNYVGMPVLAYIADTNLAQYAKANDWNIKNIEQDDYFFKILKRY